MPADNSIKPKIGKGSGEKSVEELVAYYRAQCACRLAMICGWTTVLLVLVPDWAALDFWHTAVWKSVVLGIGSFVVGSLMGKATGKAYYAFRIWLLLRKPGSEIGAAETHV